MIWNANTSASVMDGLASQAMMLYPEMSWHEIVYDWGSLPCYVCYRKPAHEMDNLGVVNPHVLPDIKTVRASMSSHVLV